MIRAERVSGQPVPTEPNPYLANRAILRSDLTSGEALVMQVIADRAGIPGPSARTVTKSWPA